MGTNDWTTVGHQNRKTNMHGSDRDQHSSHKPLTSHVRSDITSLFITNFPDSVKVGDIKRVCGRACIRLGKIVGVVIANRLSKVGKRFGFIRFTNVGNCDSLIKQLREVWFGSYKFFASLPRSLHNNNHAFQSTGLPTTFHHRFNVKSYANVVRGLTNNISNNSTTEEIIDLFSGDFIVEQRQRACLVKERYFSTLPNLRVLCLDEGFDNFEMKYVGGLWVLIEFTTKNACNNFMSNQAINHWILEKRAWDRTFVPSKRVVWVDVEGVPLSTWSKDPFRKILSKWGTIAQLDDDLGEDIFKNRVCILTTIKTIISEVIKVRVDGIIHYIRVKEALGWTPSFVHDFPVADLTESELQDSEQNEVNSYFSERNEEVSLDPFGIYDAIEKMKKDEANNEIHKGFNNWGNGKKFNNNRESTQGQNGNFDMGMAFPHSPVEHNNSNTRAASQVRLSDIPGPAVGHPTAAEIDLIACAAVAIELQAASAVSSSSTATTPKIPVHFDDSESSQTGTEQFKTQIPIGFSGGYTCMSGIPSTNESLSHPPGFSNMKYGENDAFSKGSFSTASIEVESGKTVALGGSIGLNMNSCLEHVKNTIHEERVNKI
ncbi:unnamed protein product [Lactuca saligna]|uniref:RRM domain-containing protein n=1 Tax=Lactuca saligna TaxID=75948 RepID=A0AA35Z0V2_LACSI|nr:unnamed protein product [Lactuca saligna]